MKYFSAIALILISSSQAIHLSKNKNEAPTEYLLPPHPLAEKPNQRNRICDAHSDQEGCELQIGAVNLVQKKKNEAPTEYLLPPMPLAEKPNQRNRICDAQSDQVGCERR